MSDTTTANYTMENTGGGSGAIFVSEATIVDAKSVSGMDVYKNGKPVDVGIEFTLEIGKEFKPKFTITGNFKVEDGKVVGDGSATGVKIALQRLGVKWTKLGEKNAIPEDALAQCIGKTIMRLQYPSKPKKDERGNPIEGKFQYNTYKNFYLTTVPDCKAKVRAAFDKDLAKGWVKMVSEEDTSFPPADVSNPVEEAQF